MAQARIDPREQIPEADLLEQQNPLDPRPLTDPVSEILETPGDAEEADRVEQHATVLDNDEDDYPHASSGAGWS